MFRSAMIAICLAAATTITACDSSSVAGPNDARPSLSDARHGIRGVLRRSGEGMWKLEFSDNTSARLIGGPTMLYDALADKDVYVVGLVGDEGIVVESMEEDTRIQAEFRRLPNKPAFMRRVNREIP